VVRAVVVAGAMCAALAVGAAASPSAPATATANCERTSVGLLPLKDLGEKAYQGFAGGLYPGGANVPSGTYLTEGKQAARTVVPRGPDGSPLAGGQIVLLSIGMSNTTQEFQVFMSVASADKSVSSRVRLVDGAQGGHDVERVKNPADPYWTRIDQRLAGAGVTARQVQVVWVKQAVARETRPFPEDARGLQSSLRSVVSILRARYPNLKLVYLSSRTYAGYATTPLNPEPYAYQSGFAVKWLIQERIDGKIRGPWLGWGPYLWTDGTKGRKDGLMWTCEDVRSDGTHPSPSGQAKVGGLLLRFFKSNATTRDWFRS